MVQHQEETDGTTTIGAGCCVGVHCVRHSRLKHRVI